MHLDELIEHLEKIAQAAQRLEFRVQCLEDNQKVILEQIRKLYEKHAQKEAENTPE